MYKHIIDENVLKEEFGTSKLTKTIVVSPVKWNKTLPNDWIERLMKEGYEIEEFSPGDSYLRKIEKNYKINNTLFLFVGRGLTDVTDYFYMLTKNKNVEEIIFLGTGASLIDELDRGDINIPELVLPWENVSSKYVDVSEAIPTANKELLDKVTKIAKRVSDVNVRNYNHATVELFYEETTELLEYFKKLNIATVDMELSALYRLSKYFRKKAVGILRVGDRPLHGEIVWSEKHKRKEERKNKGKENIFKIIKQLIK
jgi:purine-nucleoside phosphorylase